MASRCPTPLTKPNALKTFFARSLNCRKTFSSGFTDHNSAATVLSSAEILIFLVIKLILMSPFCAVTSTVNSSPSMNCSIIIFLLLECANAISAALLRSFAEFTTLTPLLPEESIGLITFGYLINSDSA